MEFIYEPALKEYMRRKKKTTIVVEVVTSSCSDFEITELHVHLVNEKQADFFRQKKGFHSRKTAEGEVLLPPWRLDYEETVTFGLKTFLCFSMLTYRGILV